VVKLGRGRHSNCEVYTSRIFWGFVIKFLLSGYISALGPGIAKNIPHGGLHGEDGPPRRAARSWSLPSAAVVGDGPRSV
jgi:hypothetical protein